MLAIALAACTAQTPRPGSSSSSAGIPSYTLERSRGEMKISDGLDTIVVDNPYGDIQVRQTNAAAVAYQGVEQRIGENPRIARIEQTQSGVRNVILVHYSEHDRRQPADPRLGRVDLTVFVPRTFKLDLRADFGTINVRRIDNDIRARTRTGMIVVASRGALDAESVSGEIRAWTMQAAGETPTRLRTAGNIVADIPLFDDVRIDVAGARGIRAGFPLEKLEQTADGRWVATWRNGAGRHHMQIESGAGEVVLQALHKPVP